MEENKMPEKKILAQYVITRYEDGSSDISNAENSGAVNVLDRDELFNDVCDLARAIDKQRIENAAFRGAQVAIANFYHELSMSQQAQQQAGPTLDNRQ